jgi:hypothetical protein
MSAPQSLLQAAVNRLAARLGSGLVDTAANLSLLAQDAPARLQQELSLFWEEVEQEAARLERDGSEAPLSGPPPGAGRGVWSGFSGSAASASADPQEAIDALRAQVARLARRLDGPASVAPSAAAGAEAASGAQAQGPT